MFQIALLRKRAVIVTAAAVAAAIGFGSTALAASFSSTLTAPSGITGCGVGCVAFNGPQTSSVGGAGTYAIVDKFAGPPSPGGGNFCVTLGSGSTLTLAFGSSPSTSSSIVMATDGTFCGTPPVGNNPTTLSGPYTITSGTGGFGGASGSGTIHGIYTTPGNSAHLVFSDINGTLTLPAGGGGGTGGGGGFNLSATPELDSVLLFGSGVLGLAGYALARSRVRRTGQSD